MALGSKCALVVSAVLALGGLAMIVSSRADAQGGGGDATRDLIAVTGTYGSSASVLYLIDTKTSHMAVYKTDNGRRLELVAARNFAYDLRLDSYNDQSEPGYTPRELRRGWSDQNRTGGVTSRPGNEQPAPR
jgi:hypothetical protein